MGLELRSLPSTGVTRLPRYYEPLRHPRAASLSLRGFRLVIADHALGLPTYQRWEKKKRITAVKPGGTPSSHVYYRWGEVRVNLLKEQP